MQLRRQNQAKEPHGEIGGVRALLFVSLVTLLSLSFLSPRSAQAFSTSQEAQWKTDFEEAVARAKGFKEQLKRQKTQDHQMAEEAAVEIRKRKREQEEAEHIRSQYAKQEAKLRPIEEARREKMEREDDAARAREARAEDQLRATYVLKRDEFMKKVARDAYIDPAQEYDVHTMPSIQWERDHVPEAALKLQVKDSKGN